MNLEKLNPWNWFKHEDSQLEERKNIPVSHRDRPLQATQSDSFMKLHREIDRLFDDVFNSWGMPSSLKRETGRISPSEDYVAVYRPKIDVSGDENKYEVMLDVPGLVESDLSIDVQGDVLVIKGQKEEVSENKDKHFYCVERNLGSFQRTLSLPKDANNDSIKASLNNGVLKIEISRNEISRGEVKHISISS